MKKELLLISIGLIFGLFLKYPFNQGSTSHYSYGVARSMTIDESNQKTMLTYTSYLELEVNKISETRENVLNLAKSFGGYLYGFQGNEEKEKEITLNLKIPTKNSTKFLDEVKRFGKVKSESFTANDIASQYDDVSARLESLEAERKRLMNFYDRANSTADLIKISDRLSYVDSQIKYLTSQKAQLKNRVDFTQVAVTLKEKTTWFAYAVFVSAPTLVEKFVQGINASLLNLLWLTGVLVPFGLLAIIGKIIIKIRN